MAVNMGKMRKGYESQKRGGDFFTFEQGDTKCFIHPPCREDDTYEPTEGLNYIPVVVHYNVGKNNAMVVCQDPETNPIIEHPFVKAFLKKKKIKLDGECAVCAEIASGEMDDDEADDSRPQTRYMWGITPLEQRSSKTDDWRRLNPKPCVAMVGKTLYDGFMELFFDNGDISDMAAAILGKVNRVGKGPRDTKYKVTADVQSLKKPLKLDSKLAKVIAKALAEGGDCDLFKIIANMVKSPAAVRAALTGVAVDESDEDDDDVEDTDDTEPDEDGDEGEGEDEEPEEDESGDEGEGEDESGDEDEGEGEDEEPEELPKPKVKSKGKPATKPSNKPKAKAKPQPDDDEDEGGDDDGGDDDELGLDALDEELARLSKGKGKKKG
jgi:hypothetical protein